MTRKIALPRGFKIKNGKVVAAPVYHDASAAIRAKKSKKQRPQRRCI